jgi:hypothetical protein
MLDPWLNTATPICREKTEHPPGQPERRTSSTQTDARKPYLFSISHRVNLLHLTLGAQAAKQKVAFLADNCTRRKRSGFICSCKFEVPERVMTNS